MVSPQECITRILSNDPESADSLYALLVWVRHAEGVLAEGEVDGVMSTLYSQTTDSNKHRMDHDRRLLSTERAARPTGVQHDSRMLA